MTTRVTTTMFAPLSIALAGTESLFEAGAEGFRPALAWAGSTGFAAVHLSAMMPGMRPRELSRSARRDVAAALKRAGVGCSGVDLWIPAAHFGDQAHMDRAVAAASDAIEFAADVRTLMGEGGANASTSAIPSVCLTLGTACAPAVRAALAARADTCGVRIADCTYPFGSGEVGLTSGGETASGAGDSGLVRGGPIGVGLDPAAVLLAGGNPLKLVSTLGGRLACARLSDATSVERVGAGSGQLRVFEYAVGLATGGWPGCVVTDVRGTRDLRGAAAQAVEAWKVPA